MPAVTSSELGGTGTSMTFSIPGAGLDVESVYAVIDATGAGGAVTASIEIADQSGAVIARKGQGETIDAGGVGSATWALRLDDETTAASGVSRYTGVYSGNPVTIADNSSDLLTWDFYTGGDNVLDISNPIFPQPTRTGNWMFAVDVFCTTDLTIGGQFQVEFDVIGLGSGTAVGTANYWTSPPATARVPRPRATVYGAGWMDSSSPTCKLSVTVINMDTASSRDFALNKGFAQFIDGP